MKAMPLYTLLPSLSEYAIERGWTRCYSEIEEVGWPNYIVYNILYMAFIEFFIYWMHRGLHDVKPLYKLLHATHHIYNKENTMSPFAGMRTTVCFLPLYYVRDIGSRTHCTLYCTHGLENLRA